MNVFYRLMIGSLKHAQRAAGNRRLRIHIRRAALSLQRQLEFADQESLFGARGQLSR